MRQGAVAALHARGVVHADLKPENLLLEQPLGADGASACPQVRLRIGLGLGILSRSPCRACCCRRPRQHNPASGPSQTPQNPGAGCLRATFFFFFSLTAPPGGHQVRLVDFGSAFSATATDTAALAFEVQTLPYRAPEVGGPARRARAAGVRLCSAGARPCAQFPGAC
jgi:serine/threonine protein kinase